MTMIRRLLAALVMLASTSAFATEPVPLNGATVEQLAALDGVSPELAQSIVSLRSQRGRLENLESLRVLPAMSPAAMTALKKGTTADLLIPIREATGGANAPRPTTPEAVLARFDHEPAVEMVQQWASAYAQVQPETVAKWLRASRAFGALPLLRAEFRQVDDWDNDFRYYDELGLPPTVDDGNLSPVKYAAQTGQGRYIKVQATWWLMDLVMSPEQIRVIQEAQDVVKLREKIQGEVTRLYFERRRLQVDMLLNPPSDLLSQVKDEIRLRELQANIDAYTGGAFSQALTETP